MPFREMMSDHVTLVKRDGQRFENIPASVQRAKIFIDDATIPVEEGDHFERALPNGLTERFLVLDRGFYKGLHGIPDHYQVSVRKESAIAQKAPTSVVYSATGPNARINVNSTDQSTNVVHITKDNVFIELRNAIERAPLDQAVKSHVFEVVKRMEASPDKKSFLTHYREFIGAVADHVSIFAPFIPMLTQLLG